jgi:single-strand DNA-binding protein
MSYDLAGKVKLIQEPQTFASGFTKREMVVTVEDGKYPQEIVMEFLQDKVSLLDNVSEGQEIKVSFDIRGREYNGRYFNNLVGWKIEGGDASAPAPAAATDDRPPIPSDSEAPGELDDDIPF